MIVPPAAERETTIRWDAEEKVAHIWTCDPVQVRKLDRLCEEHPEEYKVIRRDDNGVRYTAPAKLIRFGKPASEARKEACRRNAANLPTVRRCSGTPAASTDSDE